MEYTIAAFSSATGVTQARLRAWERRYGVPSPKRSPGGRRLYNDADLALVRRMLAHLNSGVSAAQSAKAALAGYETRPQLTTGSRPEPREPLVGALIRSASSLDERTADAAISDSVRVIGWGPTIDQVLFPVLRGVGEEWEEGRLVPLQEHWLSELVRSRIAAARRTPVNGEGPLVVFACPEGEQHDIGLLAVEMLTREEQPGFRTRFIGANVPLANLSWAAETLDPDIFCLSATCAASVPTIGLAARAITAARPQARVLVGGPALHAALGPSSVEDALPGVLLPHTVAEAARHIASLGEGLRSR